MRSKSSSSRLRRQGPLVDPDRANSCAMASLEGLATGTNVGQCAAVHATARLLGDEIILKFLPTPREDELWVVVPPRTIGSIWRVAISS